MNRRAWRGRAARALAALLAFAPLVASSAEVSAVDDTGHRVTLAAPAARIVSLAPHATELLFAAGAGAQVVGVSDYSDYPPQAARLPSVGNSQRIDVERVLALRPDLVVGWESGNGSTQLARLRAMGIPVFSSEPRQLATIATSLERLGTLAGSSTGLAEAGRLRSALDNLQMKYAQRRPVRVFYQIWSAPLMTLNDAHIVSEAIRLCGGVNVFGRLRPLVPTVSREAVIRADPDLIIASDEYRQGLERWREFSGLRAVRKRQLASIDGSLMNRAGPRLADATQVLCELIEGARLAQDDHENTRKAR